MTLYRGWWRFPPERGCWPVRLKKGHDIIGIPTAFPWFPWRKLKSHGLEDWNPNEVWFSIVQLASQWHHVHSADPDGPLASQLLLWAPGPKPRGSSVVARQCRNWCWGTSDWPWGSSRKSTSIQSIGGMLGDSFNCPFSSIACFQLGNCLYIKHLSRGLRSPLSRSSGHPTGQHIWTIKIHQVRMAHCGPSISSFGNSLEGFISLRRCVEPEEPTVIYRISNLGTWPRKKQQSSLHSQVIVFAGTTVLYGCVSKMANYPNIQWFCCYYMSIKHWHSATIKGATSQLHCASSPLERARLFPPPEEKQVVNSRRLGPKCRSFCVKDTRWIGLRENLQDTIVFTTKYRGFL